MLKNDSNFLGGFYKFHKDPFLMIGLNSNIWYQSNKVNFTNPDDPSGQFYWLEQTLQEAKHNDQKVDFLKGLSFKSSHKHIQAHFICFKSQRPLILHKAISFDVFKVFWGFGLLEQQSRADQKEKLIISDATFLVFGLLGPLDQTYFVGPEDSNTKIDPNAFRNIKSNSFS